MAARLLLRGRAAAPARRRRRSRPLRERRRRCSWPVRGSPAAGAVAPVAPAARRLGLVAACPVGMEVMPMLRRAPQPTTIDRSFRVPRNRCPPFPVRRGPEMTCSARGAGPCDPRHDRGSEVPNANRPGRGPVAVRRVGTTMPESPPAGSRDAASERVDPPSREVGERALLERLVAIATGERRPAGSAAATTPRSGRPRRAATSRSASTRSSRRSTSAAPGSIPGSWARAPSRWPSPTSPAMGAEPLTCLATLCARSTEQLEDVLEIQRGLCEAAAAAGCAVVGRRRQRHRRPAGDRRLRHRQPAQRAGAAPRRRTPRRPAPRHRRARALRRRAATAARRRPPRPPRRNAAGSRRTSHPVARLREGARLLAAGVRCAGDVSDGILVDAARTARA